MDAIAYHLQARAPFHFGLRGVGIEATAVYGPSDTLFSALCDTFRQHFGLETLQDFLAGYGAGEPPLLLSSAFPYVLDRREKEGRGWQPPADFDPERVVRVYPRPLELPPGVPTDPQARKTVKRIDWVSEQIFAAWAGGQDLGQHYVPGPDQARGHLVQDGRVWLTASERARVAGWRDEDSGAVRFWAVGDVPRVTVDRQDSASAVYQAGRVWCQPGGGLWLLMRWRDDWRVRGEIALQVLGDAGVGGERSAGHGLFVPHGPHALAPLSDPQPGGRFLTLSLYYPSRDEVPAVLEGDGLGYAWQVRRGWMASPDAGRDDEDRPLQGRALRRKAVRMFDQGSLLRWPPDAVRRGTVRRGTAWLGALADVTPDAFKAHTVWRYGLAYPVGFRARGGEK